MTLCTRRVGHGAVVAAMALWLVACGGSSKSTSPTTEAGANAPVGSTSTPSTTASAPPSTTKTSAPPATTSRATVAQAASPTEAVDQFLAAEKAYDCSTAFADLGSNLRASVGGTAAALCTALHKDPVSSFKPSTLINGGSNSVVQAEVTCGSGTSDFYIFYWQFFAPPPPPEPPPPPPPEGPAESIMDSTSGSSGPPCG
jgi:hypothetical protein